MNPLAAPANQLAITSPISVWDRILPSPYWLSHSERAISETLGRVWQKLQGDKLTSAEPGQ
jgi:hypothetical protein